MTFLSTREPRQLSIEAPIGFEPLGLYLGSGAMALEVAVLHASRQPTNPGLRNSGLFALHYLEHGVPDRPDWAASTAQGTHALTLRGRKLIQALGFTIQQMQGPESILVANGTKVAIALFLERADEIDPANSHFGGISPVSHALAKADQEHLDYVVIAAGVTLRIYLVKTGVGTGRRGRTETFVELNLDLLRPAQAGYLWLLYSAEAIGAEGSFGTIL